MAAERQAAAEASSDYATALTAAGLRLEVAAELVAESSDDESDEEEGEPARLLPWAVLLAYLLDMPADNPKRAKLSRAIHETHW